MDETSAPQPPRHSAKPHAELVLEKWLFRSRWLMAPFYVGLVSALLALLYVFVAEIWRELSHLPSMRAEDAIMLSLSLIDLSLAGNLIVIVIFAGYENFVAKIETGDDRPAWMGEVDFSGLKMKLIGSIVAISAIALLRAFMQMYEGQAMDRATLGWMVGLHVTFVVTSVLLALADWIASRVK
jgi:uncharacterized protein (TIGR00645 family)